MFDKIKKTLFLEKIPMIVCMMACVTSIFFGFTLGYVFLGQGESLVVYADTAHNPPESIHLAEINSEPHNRENPPQAYSSPMPVTHNDSYLYLVTALDGYIVVYYAMENGGGLKEVTSTAIGALALEEQERLKAGIRIYSDEALALILQDYGS